MQILHLRPRWISKYLRWVKEARSPKVHSVGFHLHNVLESVNWRTLAESTSWAGWVQSRGRGRFGGRKEGERRVAKGRDHSSGVMDRFMILTVRWFQGVYIRETSHCTLCTLCGLLCVHFTAVKVLKILSVTNKLCWRWAKLLLIKHVIVRHFGRSK